MTTTPDTISEGGGGVMEERKEYNLASTTIEQKWNVSTGYRQSSVCCSTPPWYFETIIFSYDPITKERDEILHMEDSGTREKSALENHYNLCTKLLDGILPWEEEDEK